MAFPRFRRPCIFSRAPLVVIERPGRVTFDSIIRAGALTARIDGQAVEAERAGLLRSLRRGGLLSRFGRSVAVAAYAAEIAHGRTRAETLASVARHAGQPSASLVASAAAHVAAADGRLDPAELDLLHDLQACLGLAGPIGAAASVQEAAA